MHARVSTYGFDAGRADEIVSAFQGGLGAIQDQEGLAGAYLLVDRGNGKAITMTLWESEEALSASAAVADRVRSEAAEGSGGTIESVESYEVALQHTP
jgi:heme-degrading monooxygenase HmoA